MLEPKALKARIRRLEPGSNRSRLLDAAEGKALNTTATNLMMAQLAYNFQLNSFDVKFPTEPVGDFVAISKVMRLKYAPYYAPACGS